VGRLGVLKKLNKEAFKAVLMRIWRLPGRVVFKEILENLWLFKFFDVGDKQKVMVGRPWSYDRTLLILHDFDRKLAPYQMDFSVSPIWVQIHNMPLGCMNQEVGFQIGSMLGKVEELAVAEDNVGCGRYLRIRVAINLYRPLEWGMTLFLTGNSCWVSFKYEKLIVLCFNCGRILQSPKGRSDLHSKKMSHEEGSKGWGLWLYADDLSKGPGITEGQPSARSSSSVLSG
jgi:hypothetical protein